MPQDYREYPIPSVAGGINDAVDPITIRDDQAADARNVDFNRYSARTSRGAIKLNNQPAPLAGLLTRTDLGLAPLSLEAGKSVPLRGYGCLPYSTRTDIGGDFVDDAAVPALFHARRGRSFSIQASVAIEPTSALFSAPQVGSSSGQQVYSSTGPQTLPVETATSFDHFAAGDVGHVHDSDWNGTVGSMVAGWTGSGQAVKNPANLHYLRKTLTQTTTNVGFVRFRVPALPVDKYGLLCFAAVSGQQFGVWVRSDGRLVVSRTTNEVDGAVSTGVVVAINTWYDLEFAVYIHDTLGTCEVRIDGVAVAGLTLANFDTKAAPANPGASSLYVGSIAGALDATDCEFDDLVWFAGSGSILAAYFKNGPARPLRVGVLRPDGPGTYSGWTPSAGANWQCVDETLQNGVTDYVSVQDAVGANKRDSYTFTGLPGPAQQVLAVRPAFFMATSLLAARKAESRPFVRIGSTNYDQPIVGTPHFDAVTYQERTACMNANPATGSAWTVAEVNAIEAGLLSSADLTNTETINLTQAVVEVVYSEDAAVGAGSTDPQVAEIIALGGYDEAMEDASCVLQKGGDRLAPMSWAIAIVNTGDRFEYKTGVAPFDRPSNLAIAFLWLDAPEWSVNTPSVMRYKVGAGGAGVGTTGSYSTLAYRSIIAKKFLEPGKSYHVSVDLKLDSGSPFSSGTLSNPTAAWNSDGTFKIVVAENEEEPAVCGTLGTNLFVWTGPTDSYDYLTRYGIRYSGRDAMFVGLGYRFGPWKENGFLPCGLDSAALERGGFSMIPVADVAPPTGHSLTCRHIAPGDTFLEVNHQALITGNTAQQQNPTGIVGSTWNGLGNGAGTVFNPQALRGYWLAVYGTGASEPRVKGARFLIGSYSEVGASYRLDCGLASVSLAWTATACNLIGFRWHQRPLRLCDVRIYRTHRDWDDPRNYVSLLSSCDPDDSTDPHAKDLVASWTLDDAGGGVLREGVSGLDGFLCPFALGVSKTGTRGANRLFLSGEGEALQFDFASDPVLMREVQNMLRSGHAGFAIELTCQMTEAFYAVAFQIGGAPIYRGKYAPWIASWEVKDQAVAGSKAYLQPLLELTHNCEWDSATTPERRPMGFMARCILADDQEGEQSSTARGMARIVTNFETGGQVWAADANWVGKAITIQFGIQPTANADEYVAYLAATPKGDLRPLAGDPSGAEVSFFTAAFKIRRRDLVRSVVTIGGRHNTRGADFSGNVDYGYSEMNCRMIVDEVRVLAAPGGGAFAATRGEAVTGRNGKLQGQGCLPARELAREDILRPVGADQATANVSEGSAVVTPAGAGRFFTVAAGSSRDAVIGSLLLIPGDSFERKNAETVVDRTAEFYFINAVAANGSNLSLVSAFNGGSQANVAARAFSIIAYTAFADDLYGRELSVGNGKSFVPGTTTAADVVVTGDFFKNLAPVAAQWRMRVYSPLGKASIAEIVPAWVRGLKRARRNPILGIRKTPDGALVVAKGSLFRADDRWRRYGPTRTMTGALAFLAKRSEVANLALPAQGDRVRFGDVSRFTLTTTLLNAGALVIDCWVKLDAIYEYQTALWMGSELGDPSRPAGATAKTEFRHHFAARFFQGRPQLAIGSNVAFSGTSKPEKGLYTATGQQALEPGRWYHVRWILRSSSDGAMLDLPELDIMGKPVSVEVNASASGSSGSQWLPTYSIPDPGADGALWLGCARDSYLAPQTAEVWTEGAIKGELVKPRQIHGALHCLGGELAGVVISSEASTLTSAQTFDPFQVNYLNRKFEALRPGAGVGHKVLDEIAAQYGLIYSHPLLSLFHEFGDSTAKATFAKFEQATYVANGGRPAYVRPNAAGHAGLLPPTTAPAFEIERKPLWPENKFVAAAIDNGPIAQAAAGADRIHHYQTFGNNYLTQTFHSELAWDKNDYFAFKCLIRPRSVSGRTVIYSARGEAASGPIFIEIRDGKLVVGWWDTVLKEEVTLSSNVPLFFPGLVHYVYVRKKHPNSSSPANYPGWRDSVWKQTALTCFDEAIVRPFMVEAPTASYSNYPTWAAKTPPQVTAGTRDCISFTTDEYSVAGTTATGLVSDSTATYTAAGNVITGPAGVFHEGMLGMLWQFGTPHGSAGLTYRIVAVNAGANTITVVDPVTGAAPVLTDAVAKAGGVFSGVRLVKSANFASSKNPDTAVYDVECFGTGLSAITFSGIAKTDAEWWSFGYFVAADTAPDSADITIFEAPRADEIETGTDDWLGTIYGATPPGELQFTSGAVFAFVDGNAYGRGDTVSSTAPNENLEIALDNRGTPQNSINAQSFFWQALQRIDTLSGVRQVRVIFYDPIQNCRSNPSPNLLIEPSAEDRSNPSGQARILLTGLPVSQDGPQVQRWVYMTLSNQFDYHRVAIVEDNSSTSLAIYQSEGEISLGPPIQLDNGPPPRCGLIAVSQLSMFYGALADQPDGVVWSKPYRPFHVPYSNFHQFSTGSSRELTGLVDFRGKLIAWKRDSMHALSIRFGAAIPEDIGEGVGCLAPASVVSLDNAIQWLAERGIYVYTGSGVPALVSPNLNEFFVNGAERRAMVHAVATINRARNQYIVTARAVGSDYEHHRVSSEFDHEYSGAASGQRPGSRYRLSRYETPDLTAIGIVDADGGTGVLLGGTEEGFAVWLDREDSTHVMAGDDTGLWGALSGTFTLISRVPDAVDFVNASPAVDTAFGGPVGARVEWVDADGTERWARILWCRSSKATGVTTLFVDRLITSAVPTSGQGWIGRIAARYETGWLTLGTPRKIKQLQHVDLFLTPQASGSATLAVYVDRQAIPKKTFTLDLTQGHVRLPAGDLRGDAFKLALRSTSPCELVGVILALRDEGQD